MATVTIHEMQTCSFTLTCAYKTWDGSLHLDVYHSHSCSNPNCVTISSVKMIYLVNSVQLNNSF